MALQVLDSSSSEISQPPGQAQRPPTANRSKHMNEKRPKSEADMRRSPSPTKYKHLEDDFQVSVCAV